MPAERFHFTQAEQYEFLRTIVNINSGTANIKGVTEVQEKVEDFCCRLGLKTELWRKPPSDAEIVAPLLIATIPSSAKKFITLLAHADTVFEPSSGFLRFTPKSDGVHVQGPGIIDDKGGIVVALSALDQFMIANPSCATDSIGVRFVCTPEEEIGSPGFAQIFEKLSADSVMILGLEPSLDDGSIIESRRGNRWYRVQVQGRESHAGRAHAQGINAGHELAIKLDRMQKLTDYSKEVTVSIGSIRAGQDKYNIVCGFGEAKVDVRFPSFESRADVHGKIEKILDERHVKSQTSGESAQTSFEIADDCPPVAKTAGSETFIREYASIIQSIEGKSIASTRSGGAADCNYFSREGLIIVDGLGPTGGGIHSTDEFLYLPSLETRSLALARFLQHCTQQLSQ